MGTAVMAGMVLRLRAGPCDHTAWITSHHLLAAYPLGNLLHPSGPQFLNL